MWKQFVIHSFAHRSLKNKVWLLWRQNLTAVLESDILGQRNHQGQDSVGLSALSCTFICNVGTYCGVLHQVEVFTDAGKETGLLSSSWSVSLLKKMPGTIVCEDEWNYKPSSAAPGLWPGEQVPGSVDVEWAAPK